MREELTDRDREAYRLLTSGEPVTDQDVDRLAEHGLADRDAWAVGDYAARDPRSVAQRLVDDAQWWVAVL